MTTAQLNSVDRHVRDNVMQQLEWDSQVDASAVGVAAKDGVVTLTGYVDTYAAKLEAERAAKRIRGVRAVANDILVRLRLDRSDAEIATDAARALDLRPNLPQSIQAVVHDGHITLTGTVTTLFQSAVAEKAMHHIKGIKGVFNHIVVNPPSTPKDIKRHIVRALHREADVSSRGIEITVNGTVAELQGAVESWHERDAAERAVMHAPGITKVINLLAVVSNVELDEAEEMC